MGCIQTRHIDLIPPQVCESLCQWCRFLWFHPSSINWLDSRQFLKSFKFEVTQFLSGTYERARYAFRRCLALHSSNRQHQLRSPVEGLTIRTLLRECKGVPTRSLPHSLCAYKTLVREKQTAWEPKNPT